MGKRKGKIEQIFSKAIYSDNPDLYIILYRDFNTIISVTLPRFMEISENLQLIPITRIVQIRKGNESHLPTKNILYSCLQDNQKN